MITHFEATVTLLGVVIGMLGTLVTVVWKARGWIDRLNATDSALAAAIKSLDENQVRQHRENQERFQAIEKRLAQQPPRGRSSAGFARPGR